MDEALVEKAAVAAREADGCGLTINGKLAFCDEEGGDRENGDCACRRTGEAVLRAVIPLIEAAAFERAAKVATHHAGPNAPQRIATAIRSLKQGDSQQPKDDV